MSLCLRLLSANLIALTRNALLALLGQNNPTLRSPVILLRGVLLQCIQANDIKRVVVGSLELHLGNVIDARINRRLPGVYVAAEPRALFDAGLAKIGALLLRPVEKGRCEVQRKRHLAGAHAGAVAGDNAPAGCRVLMEGCVEDCTYQLMFRVCNCVDAGEESTTTTRTIRSTSCQAHRSCAIIFCLLFFCFTSIFPCSFFPDMLKFEPI